MSANTSRVIWKGERPQKPLAKPGPIPKAEDPSAQKMACIHGATKRVYVLHFAALLIAATFWQASPYHRTLPSCYSLKLCKTFTSLTAINRSWFSQEILKNIFTYMEGGCMEMLGQIWEYF